MTTKTDENPPPPAPTGSGLGELAKARSIGDALAAALMGEYPRSEALAQWAADLKLPDNEDLVTRLKEEGIPVEKWERMHAEIYGPNVPAQRPPATDV